MHIVKNYTGDVMNFDMAAEMGKGDDIEVETVLTNDDVAVEDSLYTAGRRGVGVTVLVEKICGGAAEDRRSLQEVAELGRRVNANGRSMGMALTPCITPASGNPSFELADDEVEIGIGIHGEPGRFREKIGPASQIAERLMTPILEDLPFSSGDRVLAFVNGMGGTPLIELYVMYNEVAKIAQEHGLTIERNLIGNYITSLEMQGCSITLLKLDDEMVRYWDAPVNTPGSALGRLDSANHARRCARLDEPLRGRDGRAPSGARRSRHGDRRWRPRDEHEPGHDQGDGEAVRRRAGRPRRGAQDRGDGARLERRRRRRPVVRHAVPADGRRDGRPGRGRPARVRRGVAQGPGRSPGARQGGSGRQDDGGRADPGVWRRSRRRPTWTAACARRRRPPRKA